GSLWRGSVPRIRYDGRFQPHRTLPGAISSLRLGSRRDAGRAAGGGPALARGHGASNRPCRRTCPAGRAPPSADLRQVRAYGMVGTMKPHEFAGKVTFAIWEPSVRSTRS